MHATMQADTPMAFAREGMIYVRGGTFLMGSDYHYPEERPAHSVSVGDFLIDEVPVTNLQFTEFVAATGHRTLAEHPPNPQEYPGILPEMLYAGSLVFHSPDGPVDLRDWGQWWSFLKGADWRHPYGPDSGIEGLDDHPVVHVSYDDALAYARWKGKDLATEAEWEFAARGGLDQVEYAWGAEFTPGGHHMANTWQGPFPALNELGDGYAHTSPVRAFPPNGYGLHDMIGNVWEWTSDWFLAQHQADLSKPCCIPTNPRGGTEAGSYDPCQPHLRIGRKVLKGGSHLCAPNYCRRYRPAARHPQAIDTSTSHVGFRCVIRPGGSHEGSLQAHEGS